MTRKGRISVFIPLILFLALLLDGTLAFIFSAHFYTATDIYVPRLTLLCLLVFAFYAPRKNMILFSILFGLLYDSYYVGILGIYVALFPLVVYFVDKLNKILNPNFIVLSMLTIIMVSMLEFSVYGFYHMLELTTMDMSLFLAKRLGPTLLLNLLLFFIIYYPLKKSALAIVKD